MTGVPSRSPTDTKTSQARRGRRGDQTGREAAAVRCDGGLPLGTGFQVAQVEGPIGQHGDDAARGILERQGHETASW